MRVVTEIPNNVLEYFQENPKAGRLQLEREFQIPQWEARFYSHLWNNAKAIAYYQPKIEVNSGAIHSVLDLPDIHFPYHDQRALDAAINYALKKYNIQTVVVKGDGVDCHKLSYFAQDPGHMPFNEEVEAAKEQIRSLSRTFAGCELIWLEGNHEDRLRRILWGGSKVFYGLDALRIENVYEITANGWKYTSNVDALENELPILKIGKLAFLHGHEVKVSFSVVNIARVYYQRCAMNVLVGHLHSASTWIQKKLDQSHEAAWSTGCLCKINPRWRPHNNWQHGFAVASFDSDGNFEVDNKIIQNGKVL